MNNQTKNSRAVGFWYLLVAIFGLFTSGFVSPRLIVSGDIEATFRNILASEGLFRLGIFCDILTSICFLFLANSLYKLFKSIDIETVRLMVILIIASTSLAFIKLFRFAPFILLSNDLFLSVFEPIQLLALSQIFFELYDYGFIISLAFFGLWMIPLGILVFKFSSKIFNKILGIGIVIGSGGYLFSFISGLFAWNLEIITSIWMYIAVISEFIFIFWMLLRKPLSHNLLEVVTN